MRKGYRFAVLALVTVFSSVLASLGQFNGNPRTSGDTALHGIPPSVTSFGFGGHPGFHGVPPSVTSLGFGNAPAQRGLGFHHEHFNGRRHRRAVVSPFLGGYYLPYGYDYGYDDPGYYAADPGVDDSMEQNYRSGPTIFDRNGAGRAPEPLPDDYRTELNLAPAASAPVRDQPETVLVFKDGHAQEVKNYAIVGVTLYDLSEGRTRKVQLAELDLQATVKQNDDRGVSFQLPAGTKLN